MIREIEVNASWTFPTCRHISNLLKSSRPCKIHALSLWPGRTRGWSGLTNLLKHRQVGQSKTETETTVNTLYNAPVLRSHYLATPEFYQVPEKISSDRNRGFGSRKQPPQQCLDLCWREKPRSLSFPLSCDAMFWCWFGLSNLRRIQEERCSLCSCLAREFGGKG